MTTESPGGGEPFNLSAHGGTFPPTPAVSIYFPRPPVPGEHCAVSRCWKPDVCSAWMSVEVGDVKVRAALCAGCALALGRMGVPCYNIKDPRGAATPVANLSNALISHNAAPHPHEPL